jgi:competence protein ComEC
MSTPTPNNGPPVFAFKPTRQPMLWAALAYSRGIVMGAYQWRPPLWWVVAAAAFGAAAVYFRLRRGWLAGTLALGSFLLAGALHVQLRGDSVPLDTSIQPFTDGRQVQIIARVTREGRLRQASFGEERQVLDVQTEELKTETGETHAVYSGIRLSVYGPRGQEPESEEAASSQITTPLRIFHYGERIRFPAKLRQPRNFRNPGAFDYQGYLAANGIAVLGWAKSENVELIPGFAGNRVEYWRNRIVAA